jgi:DNA-binding MarR family transcriptional regulator
LSNDRRGPLLDEVGLAIRMHQNAVDEVDEAAIRYLGVNRTDLRCLDIIERRGRVTAGELAGESGLTTGAITTVLDRLAEAGYVRRVRDKADRRRVLVEPTDEARRRSAEIYGPIAEEGTRQLDTYTDEELVLIRDFMRAGRELLTAHAARVREMAERKAAAG